jgi:formylglycine-generating enzyme
LARRPAAGAFVLGGWLLAGLPVAAARGACPDNMADVLGRFCIDRFEASLASLDERGRVTTKRSPFRALQPAERVRAETRRGVWPQGYISMRQGEQACSAAGKRLCKDEEWISACQGKKPSTYPYGDAHVGGRCNDAGISPLRLLFGAKDDGVTFGWERMNDPRLNQVPGSLARTGSHGKCRNAFGVYDMVGNLHEWTADPAGTFRGGYYLDNTTHGLGCKYLTTGHSATYHDYSTGFRCCADRPGNRRR